MTHSEKMAKVTEWRNSGQPVQAWCREQKIPYNTFLNWRKMAEPATGKSKGKTKSPVIWAPVQVDTKPERVQEVIRISFGEWMIEMSAGDTADQRTITLRTVKAPC